MSKYNVIWGLSCWFSIKKKKICLPVQERWVWSLGREDPLEKEMATHSSTLAWRIPWTMEPGRLQSLDSKKSWTWLSKQTTVTNAISLQFYDNFCLWLKSWFEDAEQSRGDLARHCVCVLRRGCSDLQPAETGVVQSFCNIEREPRGVRLLCWSHTAGRW